MTGREVTGAGPLVSVLLPVWNGAATIGAAVDSMLGQTLADIEVIVIDDGSTDDTPAVLAGIHDVRLRVSRNPERRGLTASLNAGVELATSGLIARMDADDVAYPDRLALEFGLFRASPQVGLVATAYDVADGDGAGSRYVGVPPDHASVALWLLFGCCLAHPTVMFRRDVFRLVGGYRESEYPADDYGLWLRMVDVTQVATVPSPQLAVSSVEHRRLRRRCRRNARRGARACRRRHRARHHQTAVAAHRRRSDRSRSAARMRRL